MLISLLCILFRTTVQIFDISSVEVWGWMYTHFSIAHSDSQINRAYCWFLPSTKAKHLPCQKKKKKEVCEHLLPLPQISYKELGNQVEPIYCSLLLYSKNYFLFFFKRQQLPKVVGVPIF